MSEATSGDKWSMGPGCRFAHPGYSLQQSLYRKFSAIQIPFGDVTKLKSTASLKEQPETAAVAERHNKNATEFFFAASFMRGP
jgi:hypothetical protein